MKLKFFCIGKIKDAQEGFRSHYGCELGSFPTRYLGIPFYFRKLKNGEWKPVKDRFKRKLIS
jgi:hypothetical protein